jgi:hypothetical protein
MLEDYGVTTMFRALLAGAALALVAGAAGAQPHLNPTTWMCMDVNGSLRGADCKAKASRLAPNEDICLCSQGVRVQVSNCPEGVSPPGESAAVASFRRQYLRNRQTLVGAMYEGQPLCVIPRDVTRP